MTQAIDNKQQSPPNGFAHYWRRSPAPQFTNPWASTTQPSQQHDFNFGQQTSLSPRNQTLSSINADTLVDEPLMDFVNWEGQMAIEAIDTLPMQVANQNEDSAETSAYQNLQAEDATVNPAELSLLPVSTSAGVATTSSSALRRRSFACTICSKPFTKAAHLERHKGTHKKEKPFECSQCSRCFARRDNLVRHKERVHFDSSSKPKPTPRPSKSRFSLSAVKILDDWLAAHRENPYPSSDERDGLVKESGLTPKQVNTWFANARQRQLDPMARYVSSSSEDEAVSLQDIRVALERMPIPDMNDSPRYSQGSEYSLPSPRNPFDSPLPPFQLPEFARFSSASSVSSAFDQCPEARWSGPPRKGRRKYTGSMYSSCSSVASLGSDTGGTSNQFIPAHSTSPLQTPPPSSLQTHLYTHESFVRELEGGGSRFSEVSNLRKRRKVRKGEGFAEQSDSDLLDGTDAPSNLASNSFEPDPQHDLPKSIFQCTFCHVKLSEKAWRRHEESQHVPRKLWICMPSGNPLVTTFSGPSYCILCRDLCFHNGQDSAQDTHVIVCPNRASDCLARSVEERTFHRKDHLVQHMQRFHNTTPDSYETKLWESENKQVNQRWECGFCGEILLNWNARATHIAVHFRQGLDMSAWNSSRIAIESTGGNENPPVTDFTGMLL